MNVTALKCNVCGRLIDEEDELSCKWQVIRRDGEGHVHVCPKCLKNSISTYIRRIDAED